MKRIELAKFGFTRIPEEDFSDDGARFTCYRVSNTRVSKYVEDGYAYISAHYYGNDKLPYELYSKLPHFYELDRLNGVPASSISEEDLVRLYDACLAYEKEYQEAADAVIYPTIEELEAYNAPRVEACKKQVDEVAEKFTNNLLVLLDKTNKYELEVLRDYYLNLVSEYRRLLTWPKRVLNTATSLSIKTPSTSSGTSTDYWYDQFIEKFTNVMLK